MMSDQEQQQSRADFYLCLARAFLTPDAASWQGLRDALAEDLAEIASELALDIGDALADYRAAIATIPDHASLLQAYSRLFLAPPRQASINTGCYLDGALNGGSVLAMEEAYRAGGLMRRDDFHDLADHLSVQLEFVASRYLMQAAPSVTDVAGSFLGRFVAPALPALIADLEAAALPANPWLPLARMLQAAVRDDAELPDIPRQQRAMDRARQQRMMNGIGADDMAFIAQRLAERGLATDHLAIEPGQRDEALGWSRRVPPSPRRGSRCG